MKAPETIFFRWTDEGNAEFSFGSGKRMRKILYFQAKGPTEKDRTVMFMRVHDFKKDYDKKYNPEKRKTITIKTPRDAAKELIRHEVERGDSLQHITEGQHGCCTNEYTAGIGGWLGSKESCSRTEIAVTKIAGKKIVPAAVFSLREIYNEIKDETKGTLNNIQKPVKDTLRKRAKKSGKLFLTTRYSNYNKSVEGKGGKQFIDLTHAFFEPGRKTSDSSGGGPYDTRAEVAAAIHREIKHYATRYNFIPGYKTIIINDETDMKLNVNEFLAIRWSVRGGHLPVRHIPGETYIINLDKIKDITTTRYNCKGCRYRNYVHPCVVFENGTRKKYLCIKSWVAADNRTPRGPDQCIEIDEKGKIIQIYKYQNENTK